MPLLLSKIGLLAVLTLREVIASLGAFPLAQLEANLLRMNLTAHSLRQN